MKKYFLYSFFLFFFVGNLAAQKALKAPAWSYDQTIFEVNLRQYTPSGTIKAFEAELPRLQKLGVGILWFMPLHPIGVENRKGTLGSYYSVKDYYGLDPNLGTPKDFKLLVAEAHKLGMHVIIDWVANHTSWDNALVKSHPEFYMHDSTGKFIPPVADWTDVIDLNYENEALWAYMTGAMEYWIKEYDIDGFRCDVAGMVPEAFWSYLFPKLSALKNLFMLAEDERPVDHTTAFHMTYGWNMYHLFNEIAKGKNSPQDIFALLQHEDSVYSPRAFRMRFITNHDENSWNGTEYERLGDGVKAFSVLEFTLPGMPLIYSGQEAGLNKRLSFFERDPIEWKQSDMAPLLTNLVSLKKEFKVLDAADKGAPLTQVHNSNENNVISFVRAKGKEKVFVVVNLSKEETEASFQNLPAMANAKDFLAKQKVNIRKGFSLKLKPWGYKVFVCK